MISPRWKRLLWVLLFLAVAYLLGSTAQEQLGVVAILAVTAHPLGLLTPAHLAAGLVGLSAGPYAVAVTLAAPIRTAPYAFLGTAVLDLTGTQSLAIAGALLLVFVLPLLSPKVRGWVWGARGSADHEAR